MSTLVRKKLEISQLNMSFGDVTALDNVSLDFHEEEFVSVVGTSGCGKSTLLNIIAGLQEPSSGSVTVDGTQVLGAGRDRGVVFQQATLLPWLTAQGNIEFALEPGGYGKVERSRIAKDYLASVGLSGFEDMFPSQLSGGMQQRVALARSLSYQPKLLLMDEPFGALDALTRRTMQQLLMKVWEEHKLTVMLITHDIDEAVFCSDRVVVMSSRPGRIKTEYSIDLPRPRDEETFIHPSFRGYYKEILSHINQGVV
ncbi:ABC transporter ATP-binding protein [Arthrobacter sp.]|uniref:ABC transporter ATP-binding protein n=1 Tax=Arthrobacter sp. TaxID=1667 RepID=UPI0028116DA8|nr:ABC transporter ATP-binding protein [Arthrobacter sp.]